MVFYPANIGRDRGWFIELPNLLRVFRRPLLNWWSSDKSLTVRFHSLRLLSIFPFQGFDKDNSYFVAGNFNQGQFVQQ